MDSRSKVYTTPIGRLVYPNLNTPRQFNNQGKFSYDVDLDMEGEAGENFVRFLEAYADEYAKRVGKRKMDLDAIVKPAIDFKTKEELADTTRVKFRVSVIETKRGIWDKKPAFFRADGTPFETEPQVGGGTLAQIAFTVYEWKASTHGMTLQPEGVLIHELVERQGALDRSFTSLFGGAATANPKRATNSSADF